MSQAEWAQSLAAPVCLPEAESPEYVGRALPGLLNSVLETSVEAYPLVITCNPDGASASLCVACGNLRSPRVHGSKRCAVLATLSDGDPPLEYERDLLAGFAESAFGVAKAGSDRALVAFLSCGVGPHESSLRVGGRRRPTIVLVEAGSAVFACGLMADLIRSGRPCEVGLVDVDPRALEITLLLASRVVEADDADVNVSASVGRCHGLLGASDVVSTIGVGGTVMPGGISRTLRQIPATLAIAADEERLGPEAWFFNHANPMAGIDLAVHRGIFSFEKTIAAGDCGYHQTADQACCQVPLDTLMFERNTGQATNLPPGWPLEHLCEVQEPSVAPIPLGHAPPLVQSQRIKQQPAIERVVRSAADRPEETVLEALVLDVSTGTLQDCRSIANKLWDPKAGALQNIGVAL